MDLEYVFMRDNDFLFKSLQEVKEKLDYQDKIIKELRKKLAGRKEVLKDELMVDYKGLEARANRLLKDYQLAPFHMTEKEHRDYKDFCENHNDDCYNYSESNLIFHYFESMYKHKIEVECPYCHTRRKLGSGQDETAEKKE